MALDEILNAIRNDVEGARAVLLVGSDGMIVAAAAPEGNAPWEAAAASHADLARKAAAAQSAADFGAPREMIVGSAGETLVWRAVNEEYALLAILDAGGSLGRARYELRRAASALLPEL